MLSQIDYYAPSEMSLAEADERQADYIESEFLAGEWEAITSPYASRLSGKSSEWWEGFLTTLADRHGVSFACFPQDHLSIADEF